MIVPRKDGVNNFQTTAERYIRYIPGLVSCQGAILKKKETPRNVYSEY